MNFQPPAGGGRGRVMRVLFTVSPYDDVQPAGSDSGARLATHERRGI